MTNSEAAASIPDNAQRPQAGRDELYPFESHFYTLPAGHRLHYLDEGAGDPVVMVHGNPTWSFYYRALIQRLRGSYRTIAPDHIGCGLSDTPGDEDYSYDLAQRAADLESLLEHLELRANITLVVHDWGGMIGMVYATRHPERVRRLVVLNTAAFHLPQSKRFPLLLWMVRNTPVGPFLVRGLNMFCRLAARMCVTRKRLPRKVRAAYLKPYGSWRERIAILRFVQDIPLKPGDPSYALISQVQDGLAALRGLPLLIGWGLRDFVFDHHFLAEWQRRFPEAEVHAFADCGHYILEDAAAELLPQIETFLQQHPLAEPDATGESPA